MTINRRDKAYLGILEEAKPTTAALKAVAGCAISNRVYEKKNDARANCWSQSPLDERADAEGAGRRKRSPEIGVNAGEGGTGDSNAGDSNALSSDPEDSNAGEDSARSKK